MRVELPIQKDVPTSGNSVSTRERAPKIQSLQSAVGGIDSRAWIAVALPPRAMVAISRRLNSVPRYEDNSSRREVTQ